MAKKIKEGDILEKKSGSIWSTERVLKLLEDAEEYGLEYKDIENPFHENEPELKAGNVIWEYTEWELEEIKRCASDVIYFANNYCNVMTDEGIQKIKLRDYQIQILEQFQHHRKNVFVSPRQAGKCFSPNTSVEIEGKGKEKISSLYNKKSKIISAIKNILYIFIEKLS